MLRPLLSRTLATSTALLLFSAALGPTSRAASAEFELTSPAFSQGEQIPTKYTADGAGVSPPLHWSGLPKGSSELVLIVDDPDAPRGTFTHWVLYGISTATQGIPASRPSPEPRISKPVQASQGLNSRGTLGYTPPSPPKGDSPHHYHFKLYALDRKLALPPGLSSEALQARISKHVRGVTELVVIYGR